MNPNKNCVGNFCTVDTLISIHCAHSAKATISVKYILSDTLYLASSFRKISLIKVDRLE